MDILKLATEICIEPYRNPPAGAIAYKYADPTEGARWVYDEQDLRDIRREDPSLVVEINA